MSARPTEVSAVVVRRRCVQVAIKMRISFPSPVPTLGHDIEEAVRSVAQELGCSREEMLRVIVRDWFEQNAYLPVLYLNDEGKAGGDP